MADQLHASLTSPSPMGSVGWSGVKHTAIGLCRLQCIALKTVVWSNESFFSVRWLSLALADVR